MASGVHPTRIRIEDHPSCFSPTQTCGRCGKNDGVELSPLLKDHKIATLVSGTRVPAYAITDKDVVHLSCSPDQPYHYRCLHDWLSQSHFKGCPLHNREVTIEQRPDCLVPGVNRLQGSSLMIDLIIQVRQPHQFASNPTSDEFAKFYGIIPQGFHL